ncbi:MAG TPA: thioredoxin domain-containing protein [Pirellulales bacterium]|jgi:thioredoxin|nr:thioredoxin domain-containing protein [Pirellulales bacterium]
MSRLNAALNVVVFVGIAIVGYLAFSRARHTEPPNDAWFKSAVVDRPELVVVKFGAPWCGPCRKLDPELTKLASSLGGRASVVRIDVGEHRDLARHYGVSSIPRLMVFHHGQVLADRVGYADHHQLSDWVTALGTP